MSGLYHNRDIIISRMPEPDSGTTLLETMLTRTLVEMLNLEYLQLGSIRLEILKKMVFEMLNLFTKITVIPKNT